MAKDNEQLGKQEWKKLDDDTLNKISGGAIHLQNDGSGKYEILNDRTGEIIDRDWIYNDYIEDYCRRKGVSTRIINDDEYNTLRNIWYGAHPFDRWN